ncbi:MAG: hypothetical protein ABW061_16505, partial [Polyangiaceae bacterium]
MRNRLPRSLVLSGVPLALLASAFGVWSCSSSSGSGGTGGSIATTGGAGSGGPGTAGAPANGGASPAGGNSSGGSPATGGGNPAGGVGTGGVGTGGTGADAGNAGTGTAGTGTAGAPTEVTVQLTQAHQTIDGFGINDTFATDAWTASIADHLFKTDGNGIGLSLLRVGMNSSGSLVNNSVQSADMKLAKDRGAKVIGSTWSPPASCKTNNSEKDGGHVKASCYDSWGDTIAKFAGDNALYAMSIGNEPDFASCGDAEPCNGSYETTVYTAKELVAFAKVAGPKLKAKGVKAIIGEASEWIHAWSNESATGSVPSNKNSSDPLKCGFPPSNAACDQGDGYDYGHWLAKDAEAWAAVDIFGVHEYDTQRAEPWPSDVPTRKPVWQTEMSGVKWWPEQGTLAAGGGSSVGGYNVTPTTHIENGVAVARWVHSGLVDGEANAWLYWWYKAIDTDDNEGLLTKSGTTAKRYYTFGN